MSLQVDVWQLLAGVGLFLFGMHQLESALSRLAGRSFKRFLRMHTAPPVRAVVAGAVATAALQSSSVVSLIVLAFVATGIVSLGGALGIVFGANLGTTVTGWIVAAVGFKLDIEAIALPLIAAGGAGVALTHTEKRLANFSRLGLGFGLMLLALAFMKEGIASAGSLFDPQALAGRPLWVFLLAGMFISGLVQSSSATIMIALSALHAGILTLPAAVAVAIGADLGTVSTSLLGAIAGSPAKKRVAAGIVIFNVVTDAMAFAILPHLLVFIAVVLEIDDPLFTLVAFHSLFNLMGLLFFLPLITPLSRRLEHVFQNTHGKLLRHIVPHDLSLPEAAVENIERETARVIDQVAAFNQAAFDLTPVFSVYSNEDDRLDVIIFSDARACETGYSAAKELEGEILAYCLDLQKMPMGASETARLNQLIQSNRNAIHAAKCIRDTVHDLHQMQESELDSFHAYALRFRNYISAFFAEVGKLRAGVPNEVIFETLAFLKKRNAELHKEMHERIFEEVRNDGLSRFQTSTLLNVNREIYNSNETLLIAVADLMLDHHSAASFSAIPAAL